MLGQRTSIFDGVPADALAAALAHLPRRAFAAGETLIEEGEERPREVFVIEAGEAEILAAAPDGRAHLLNRAGPGATLGEMALITGDPATATVRAVTPVTALVLSESLFHELATAHPRIYLNLGVLLSERLAATNRKAVRARAGRLTWIEERGGAPLAGYALACSVAWHTRRPALLVVLDDAAPDDLSRVARIKADGPTEGVRPPAQPARAEAIVADREGAFAPDALRGTLDRLCDRYDHVLVQASPGAAGREGEATVRLLGAHAAPSHGGGPILRAWSEGQSRDGVLDVSPPDATEREALARGVLPAAGPAGASLGRAAREIAGLRVGLALGAGAVKGYAHIGVMRGLARLGVPLDCVAGTSIGAAVAALIASGAGPERAAATLDDVGAAAFRPTVPRISLLSSAGLREGLRRVAGEARIEDLDLPLAVVAADLVAHREVVFRRGPVWRAVLASMSIPGIYPPQRLGPALLVDGGVLNPVPTDVAAGMGADVVVAVRLGSPPGAGIGGSASPAMPTVVQAIARTFEVMQTRITAVAAAPATVLLEPTFDPGEGWGLRNFAAGRRFIPLGEAAVEGARPALADALPWLRPAER